MEDLLELDTRRRIFHFLQEYPGLHLRELARQLDLDVRALKHHLDFLEANEAVTSIQQNGYLRYYPRAWEEGFFRERIGASEKRVLGMLRQRVPLHLVLLLLDQQELGTDALQAELGLAKSTLSYHLGKLRRLHLVTWRTEEKRRLYRLEDPHVAVRLLVQFQPTPDLVQDFLDLWENIGL